LNPGQSATLNVQFNPTVAGAAAGTLTIASNSTSSSTIVISLSGTGAAVSHEVDLSWNAPTSSPTSVVGYYIYRAASGSSSYQQLNTSNVTTTTYVDSNVQSGQSYTYMVRSVDASGATSAPSNIATAVIP
jgi:fibronectin type 3 domain-containing protein